MNDFEQLRYYTALVESGSASKAAEKLDVAVSAVSRRLKELEQHLGVQLLQRTTRRMHLTEAGDQFYRRAVTILESLEDAKESVRQGERQLSGRIRIACPVSFGVAHIVPAIASFMHQHPAVRVDLEMNDRRLDLIEEGIDLAIRIGNLQDSTYRARKLANFTHVVCGSPDFFALHGEPQTPDDLVSFPGLCYGNLKHPDIWSYHSIDGDVGEVKVPVKMQVSNGDGLRECAIAGLGLLCEPSFIVHQAIEQRLLQPVLTQYRWYGMNIFALYPGTRFIPARVRCLLDFLASRFGGTPYWESFLQSAW